MLPQQAPDWVDHAPLSKTVGELHSEDKQPQFMEDNEGKQKKELKFFTTTGDPTGGEGFAFWNQEARSTQDLQVTISFSVAMVEQAMEAMTEEKQTQWQIEESLLQAAVNATTR